VVIESVNGPDVAIDEADEGIVSAYQWVVHSYAAASSANPISYATAKGATPTLYMHRLIMGAPNGLEVDHRDSDGLNNRRSNLRIATHQQNQVNKRKRAGCSSRYKGVCFATKIDKWVAYIVINGKQQHLGVFITEESAARAYDVAAVETWGSFARPNLTDVGQR
jgi:hypothetical protein